jgi:hypothetical protein
VLLRPVLPAVAADSKPTAGVLGCEPLDYKIEGQLVLLRQIACVAEKIPVRLILNDADNRI